MVKKIVWCFFILCLLIGTPHTASAQKQPPPNGGGNESIPSPEMAAITVDGAWQAFTWNSAGTPFTDGPYTFTSTGKVKIRLTDLYCSGDRFAVFDNSILLGYTSAPISDPPCSLYLADPDLAYVDKYYSNGTFILPPGDHSITIQVTQNPFNSGGGSLRVDSDNAYGYVFIDQNRNQTRDISETTGISVVVKMTRNGLPYDNESSTNPDGYYQLWGGRRAGTYCIEIQIPRGYHSTTITEQCQVISAGQAFIKNFGVLPPVFMPAIIKMNP